MTAVNGSHKMIEAIDRSINAKRTALRSRHIPESVRKEIENDIDILERVKQIIYRSIDSQPLFV